MVEAWSRWPCSGCDRLTSSGLLSRIDTLDRRQLCHAQTAKGEVAVIGTGPDTDRPPL
jgi:hypothetical protein